ncbi:MAG: hypothetical protein JF585_03670 [Burkholderiales bacterium]|nr:hypothetical protein [Burkholderiales bacterium]
MFHYSRPRPYVHVFSLRGHRLIRRLFTGGALVLLGIGFLLKNQGLVGARELWLIAPALIALSGLARLIAAPGAVNAVRALLRLGVAAYLVVVIEHIGGWTFAATWPVLLIVVGGSMLGYEWLVRRHSRERNW